MTQQQTTAAQQVRLAGLAESLISTVNKGYSWDAIIEEIEEMAVAARKMRAEGARDAEEAAHAQIE